MTGIVLDSVSLTRGGRRVIDTLSVTLTGQRVGIIGRNGSGKSTFARLLNGLLSPDSGTVRVEGIDISADRDRAIATVGMIFQNPDHQIIFPTVDEEIAFGLAQQGRGAREARAAALDLLRRHGREHWAGRSTQALSQGQRHLVCLLSILAMEPQVVVLDEPYAGLDIPTSRHLHGWLARLEQRVVLITHDLDVLEGFDQILWLERGRVAQLGGPEVLESYRAAMLEMGADDAGADASI